MSTALAERPKLAPDELDLIKRTVAAGASDAELKLFLFDCQRRGIHPLDRLLHFTKRGGKYTPVTSIDFMRTRAAETGEMAGSDDAAFDADDEGHLIAATVTVYRLTQGQRFAYSATARWAEYCPENAPMWRKMPHTMLGKCAEALALRKAFPQQLAGLYASEELDQASTPSTAPDPARLVAAPATADEVPAVVDTETGAQLPEAPAGFHYVTDYALRNNGWHEATLLNWTLQGDPMRISTKRPFGSLLERAAAESIPVKCDVAPKPNKPGEGYVNSVELLKASKPAESLPPIHADDLKF